MEMGDQTKSGGGQVTPESDKIACHLVSLPTVRLTRIDVNSLKTKKSTNKNSSNSVALKKKKTSLVNAHVTKLSSNKIAFDNRSRGRPKDESLKSQNSLKKPMKPELSQKSKKHIVKHKSVNKPQIGTAKSILKKTMLQKKSKIVIPQAKKPKLLNKTKIKQTPQKVVKIKKSPQKVIKISKQSSQKVVKINKQPTQKIVQTAKPAQPKKINSSKQSSQQIIKTKVQSSQKSMKPNIFYSEVKSPNNNNNTADTNSSEDEFLYDELIGEFEDTFSKYIKKSEKTTNITLKPSTGNKPPTIVKGGIIKIDNLPADLKTIASTGKQPPKNLNNEPLVKKRANLTHTECPTPPKKPSPWPISMTPAKGSNNASPNKNKKKPTSKTKSMDSNVKPKNSGKSQPKSANKTVSSVSNNIGPDNSSVVETKAPLPSPPKHKIGPKRIFEVDPTLKALNDEESQSEDEYTEIETLENLDYTVENNISEPVKRSKCYVPKNDSKKPLTSINDLKEDEDPNLDLLRILTDESDDCTLTPCETSKSHMTKDTKPSVNSEIKVSTNIKQQMKKESPPPEELQANEEPKVKTIYDLINEVTLQRPSWNLHIMPETNAFCIAQVTKGRLGLPTLKKCIELDAEDYKAKVYIHQYHIKRFDGVYDSEDSILGLIEEIDSIKA